MGFHHRNAEEEIGTFSGLGLYSNTAPMLLHDFFTDGKTNARAGELFTGVQSLEQRKDAIKVFWVNADAVIAHAYSPMILLRLS